MKVTKVIVCVPRERVNPEHVLLSNTLVARAKGAAITRMPYHSSLLFCVSGYLQNPGTFQPHLGRLWVDQILTVALIAYYQPLSDL